MSQESFGFAALLLSAHWVVQVVLLLLAFFSVLSWAVALKKYAEMKTTTFLNQRFWMRFHHESSILKLSQELRVQDRCPLVRLFVSAMEEWKISTHRRHAQRQTLEERIARILSLHLLEENARNERLLPVLATIGSSAPFIGLFGTVWGIMNSFRAISATQQSSLAVVAPGIAEALFATALGLVAAIPATIFYNLLLVRANRIHLDLETFVEQLTIRFSRQFDDMASSSR